MQGYQFCDLLLRSAASGAEEVLARAAQTLEWMTNDPHAPLLTVVLDHLSLGRMYLLQAQNIPLNLPSKGDFPDSPFEGGRGDVSSASTASATAPATDPLAQAEHHLHLAVTGLRQAGTQQYLPLGLLARAALYRVQENFAAAWEDLDEAQEIATRGEMRLHLTDYHLKACRLCLEEQRAGSGEHEAKSKLQEAGEHLAAAEKLIAETGYHRRDGEAAALRQELADFE